MEDEFDDLEKYKYSQEFQLDVFLDEEGDKEFEIVLAKRKHQQNQREEDLYLELIEKGINPSKAAHKINQITEKKIKTGLSK